jgi:hypothetical protein
MAMPKGVFGLSTALSGLFSYPCLFAPSGFTFSALLCLFREKVDMERAGREAAGRAFAEGAFSGEKDARVAEGVLLCEDCVPLEVLVRKEAERERRNVVPMSATEDEMECLDACLRRGGVVSTFGGNSYWLGKRGLGWSVRLELDEEGGGFGWGGGVVALDREGSAPCLLDLERPPKNEGRRVKMLLELGWEEDEDEGGGAAEEEESCWSAIITVLLAVPGSRQSGRRLEANGRSRGSRLLQRCAVTRHAHQCAAVPGVRCCERLRDGWSAEGARRWGEGGDSDGDETAGLGAGWVSRPSYS